MKLYTGTILLLFLTLRAQAAILVISGIYQGKNLLVQNPSLGEENKFATHEVYVNDTKVACDLTQSVYEIDLSAFNVNSQLTIKITHHDQGHPHPLNPQVIKPAGLFHFTSFQICKEKIRWSTKGETQKGKYLLEYYQNGKWLLLKELHANGSLIHNTYETSGVKKGSVKYRVRLIESDKVHYSPIAEFTW